MIYSIYAFSLDSYDSIESAKKNNGHWLIRTVEYTKPFTGVGVSPFADILELIETTAIMLGYENTVIPYICSEQGDVVWEKIQLN